MSISPSTKKKILVTGGAGMLAYDYIRMCADRYDIVALDRDTCDISSYESIIQNIAIHSPDILLNLAAYTAVDTAETTGALSAYTVNTLGTYHLARATGAFDIPFISISTDYVFDGTCSTGYTPTDTCSPIGVYGMSKYLGEQMAFAENKKSVVVRTSWLYGGERYQESDIRDQEGVYKNFVNTMLKLSQTRDTLQVVADQHGVPTYCGDLVHALARVIDDIDTYQGQILHFSNASTSESGITWADFAREIFTISDIHTTIVDCTSAQYPTPARRPMYSVLRNSSSISLPDWRDGLRRYLLGVGM